MTSIDSASGQICLDNIIFGLQRYGGISNYWIRLANEVNGQLGQGARFVTPKQVIAEVAREARFQPIGLAQETLPTRLSRYLPFETDHCRVAHTSYYRIPRRPVEVYIATAYDFMYERYRTGPAKLVHSAQKRRSLRAADLVVCISAFTREDALNQIPDLDPDKVISIPLGVDTSLFYADQTEGRLGLRDTAIFVGQRSGYKRFDLALDAIARVPDLRLGIVGPALTQPEKETIEGKIPGRWTHFGAVDDGELRQIYSSAFALVYPSDCEGFGLPVLEAMACGCPVVCSGLASLPEVGGNAALFAADQTAEAYTEKLTALLPDDVRQGAVMRGTENVRRFSWKQTLQDTIALYKA